MIAPAGTEFGRIVVRPPGPRSRQLARELREVESRNVTFVGAHAPIFLESGAGANLRDVDGNVYVDLTGAFGVASVGHGNPRVAEAVNAQARMLLHGMGDVHPTEAKVELARALCELTPGSGPKRVIFATSGAEAIEAAIKTAIVATGKPRVLAFSGAYHGLTYGALALSDGRLFREPFEQQLPDIEQRAPYPYCFRCPLGLDYPRCGVTCFKLVEEALDGPNAGDIGAVVVEPIQGRGGDVPAPREWLTLLRAACDARGLLLIADEIYTGFGRTGSWFACSDAGVVPDIICVGKGMAAGFPMSACVGRAEVMDRWPESSGAAIHTSTFLGSPAGCVAALASIAEIREHDLVKRAATLGEFVGTRLRSMARFSERIGDVRGRGLMWGVEIVDKANNPDGARAKAAVASALERGVLALTAGKADHVIQLAPPLVITQEQLDFALSVLADAIAA